MPLLFAAACSNSDNKSGSPDAAPTGSDAPAGSTFKVSGTATAQSIGASTAAAYIKIAAYASSDETTPVATTKADDKGNYTLELPVGVPLDGYLKATSDTTTAPTSGSYVDTYLYPPVALAADFPNAAINMIPTSLFPTLAALGHLSTGQGVIALEVIESLSAASLTFVEKAKVTSTPAPASYGYSTSATNSLPKLTTAADDQGTLVDGRAFLFGYAPGSVTLTATKDGVTFKPTTLKVHADAFTTTLISE